MSTCGTGGWGGPLPGDPDNNVTLTAAKIYGGIQVAWSFPATNPHAVAHVLLYRGTNPIFEQALQLAIVSANFYFDPNNSADTYSYYYWIKVVSINGTVGAAIGPASASSTPSIGDVIAQLSGQINDTALAASLRTKLSDITLNSAGIANLVSKRLLDNSTWEAALLALSGQISGAETLIAEYALQRTRDNLAFALKVDAQAAVNAAGIASAITAYDLTLVDDRDALALSVDELHVSNNTNSAAITNISEVAIGYPTKVSDIHGSIYRGDGAFEVYPATVFPITNPLYKPYSLDRTRIIDTIGVARWNATKTEKLYWLPFGIAQAIKTLGVSDGSGFLTIEQRMTAQKTLNDKLKGEWTIKVDTGKAITGIGLSADSGGASNFIINADNFAIFKAVVAGQTVGVSPFIVDALSGKVLIKNALIEKLDATNINAAAIQIKSPDYDLAGAAGEGIFVSSSGIYAKKNGAATFSIGSDGNATFSGTLSAGIVKAGTIDGSAVSTGNIADGAISLMTSAGNGTKCTLRTMSAATILVIATFGTYTDTITQTDPASSWEVTTVDSGTVVINGSSYSGTGTFITTLSSDASTGPTDLNEFTATATNGGGASILAVAYYK